MQKLHTTIRNRAVESEYLGLTLDQYKIITKEAFWPIEYFNITQNTTFTTAQYQTDIGIQPDYAYWGYSNETDETTFRIQLRTGTHLRRSTIPSASAITYIRSSRSSQNAIYQSYISIWLGINNPRKSTIQLQIPHDAG